MEFLNILHEMYEEEIESLEKDEIFTVVINDAIVVYLQTGEGIDVNIEINPPKHDDIFTGLGGQ